MMSGTRLDPNELAILVSDAVAMELEQFELRRAEYDLSPERSAVLAQNSVGYAASCKDGLMSNDFESVEALMHEVLHQREISIDPESTAWREFGRAMLRGLSNGYIRDAMRCLGEYEEDAQGSMPLPTVWQAFGAPATGGAFTARPTPVQTTYLGVRREKAALFLWVQIPPGNRSSRKQPEQAWRRRNVWCARKAGEF